MSEKRLQDLIGDIEFIRKYPDIPIENTCSTLNNYHPKNEGQKDLLDTARKFIKLDEGTNAGIWAYGPAGVGKTHIAIGIAKELTMAGIRTNYINCSKLTRNQTNITKNGTPYFIIDDLSETIGKEPQLIKDVINYVHDIGGKVFITSNVSYETYIAKLFFLNKGEEIKFIDRQKALFKVIEMGGESQRDQSVWYK